MRRIRPVLVLLAVLEAAGAAAQTPTCPSGPPCQGGPLPSPLPLFPPTNWWNLDITSAPVDANSGNYISFIGPSTPVHPDFGGPVDPGPPPSDQVYGMPYIVVAGTQPKLTVDFVEFASESDGVGVPFYPIPTQAITTPHWIESGEPGNQNPGGDRHMLIVDSDNNLLYELYHVFYNGTNWQAGSGAFFDMNTNNRRPEGWTSADAAGLAILPGLVRYDEAYVNAGPIKHAFRVTVQATNGHVYPASHTAGGTAGALPMGARLRLNPGVTVSSPDPGVQRIVQALKTYGLIVADNGSDMYVGGTFDDRWDNGILNPALGMLHASDFQVIQLGYNPPVCPPPALSINDTSVPEGNTGTVNASFTVSLSPAITAACPAATVSYQTANGTAIAGSDYGIVIGTLTFPPGTTTQPITVPVMGDRIFEGNETFFVNLSGPVNATIADGQGVGTIVDDDPPGLSVNDVTAVEGTTAVFTVTLSPVNPTQTVTVNYTTANGTATAGSDYQLASGTLTFPPGTATQPISVVINADSLVEGAETYFVNLSVPVNAAIAYPQGTGTILDKQGGGDFNGDGKPDILWRNQATGDDLVWLMNGTTLAGGAVLTPVTDTTWTIAGTADFNADGKTDILWRNTANGANLVWFMNGTTLASGAVLTAVSDLNWRIVATGDFNGDGKPDILWRHQASGDNLVWFMNGTAVAGGAVLTPIADTSWVVGGVGDFNGDGKPDILWRNQASGDNLVWFMNGTTIASGAVLTPISDVSWQIRGVGDFNGDGKPDILWRNQASGDNLVWFMNGTTLTGGAVLTSVTDTTWKIVGPR